ncbi:MAG: alpha-hydroxy-acid oxidizing protein [Labilithrix sp.]|nr:alpha-hydroxy-acid oxidizing protein [Labilithrix sp.]
MIQPPAQLSSLVTVDDYEVAARERLTPMAYDYYRSGADEEHTLRRNRDAFARYELWYRTMVDVSAPRVATTVLGDDVAFPILVAPTAYHRLACAEGERATARAAAELGSLYCASTLATTTLEDVASAAPDAARWFQLYVHKDRDFTARLLARAKAAGYRAIVVTADTPVLGRRCADVRNGFCLPDGLVMENLVDALPPDLREGAGSELARFVASRHDPAFVWSDLVAIAAQAAPLPVVVKGIARADDARRALDHGARAVWVSNHGGRQLDLAPATIDALAEVVRAVGDRCEVYVDGGVRSGTHALVALALGARAVFVGRPVLWGLAAAGAEGVSGVLTLLRDELVRAMQLAGCPDLESTRDDVVRRRLASSGSFP